MKNYRESAGNCGHWSVVLDVQPKLGCLLYCCIYYTVDREFIAIKKFSPIAQVAKIKHAVQLAIAS